MSAVRLANESWRSLVIGISTFPLIPFSNVLSDLASFLPSDLLELRKATSHCRDS
ncbi:hypothetical protein BR93DRAFT_932411 [Coniochaeta sp. PMI_546]|nr:hypothetical protein BR93DRAFT_932411 [Coniochaeta sp. PMI_546]